ncbi:TetR/AcrR family transcriptional regulator [Actinomadura sp. HBU206391]|uniref:TetR/AcrR family transcriptional regulator n=1 Tax=Actinomadura sp. HBU206391 TaxID=2731692 RepID=UPI00164EF044|nr:TetR/AcrR family transcriptional regulator [Actinomadura sp. HBU206391]MBC6463437.1 TetR/AcrR family transcriptional regulator [Actinomadura sp. HBU206391]
MAKQTKPDRVRERILTSASELFYNEGINSTGVDRISEAAGVSKRSLYQRFTGKDELVAAYLTARGPALIDVFLPAEDDDATPRERMLAVFSTLRAESGAGDFRGCAFVNAAVELPDPAHPARAVTLDHKLQVEAFFARQAALAGADDPDGLAQQLAVIFDGAMCYALVRAASVPESVHTAAETLIDACIPPA